MGVENLGIPKDPNGNPNLLDLEDYNRIGVSNIPDKEEAFKQVIFVLLHREITYDNLFGLALPLLYGFKKRLPQIPVILYVLQDPKVGEEELKFLLRILVATNSVSEYRKGIDGLLERKPSLIDFFEGLF